MSGSPGRRATPLRLRPLSRAEVRGIDETCIQQFGLPGIVLMENAGRGATDVLLELGLAGNVLIVAGKGNNGGDGVVIARHLQLAGLDPMVILTCEPDSIVGDARTNLDVAVAAGIRIKPYEPAAFAQQLATADWVIDALLGTGSRGTPRPPMDSIIHDISGAQANVVAIDIPSGLDCDTGEAAGSCIRANHTITFVAPKIGMMNANDRVGQIHVVGIGAPLAVLLPYVG